jgi:hypothetical protein
MANPLHYHLYSAERTLFFGCLALSIISKKLQVTHIKLKPAIHRISALTKPYRSTTFFVDHKSINESKSSTVHVYYYHVKGFSVSTVQ